MADEVENIVVEIPDPETHEYISQRLQTVELTPNQKKLAERSRIEAEGFFPGNKHLMWLFVKNALQDLRLPVSEEERGQLEPHFSYEFEQDEFLTRYPVVDRATVTVDGTSIEVLYHLPGESIDHEQLDQIQNILSQIGKLSPESLKVVQKIFVVPEDERQDIGGYGKNGRVLRRTIDHHYTAIMMTKRGWNAEIEHRIPGVTNFAGTFTHEMAHIIQDQIPTVLNGFTRSIGYHWIRDFDTTIKKIVLSPGWSVETDKNGIDKYLFHEETGIKSKTGRVPVDLEGLPTSYAGFDSSEDFCESFVAWFFGRPLDKTRQEFFDKMFPDFSES